MSAYDDYVLNLYRDTLNQTVIDIKKQLKWWSGIGLSKLKYQDKKFLLEALESAIGFERYLWELTNIIGEDDGNDE